MMLLKKCGDDNAVTEMGVIIMILDINNNWLFQIIMLIMMCRKMEMVTSVIIYMQNVFKYLIINTFFKNK